VKIKMNKYPIEGSEAAAVRLIRTQANLALVANVDGVCISSISNLHRKEKEMADFKQIKGNHIMRLTEHA
jgi:hypothetical protein